MRRWIFALIMLLTLPRSAAAQSLTTSGNSLPATCRPTTTVKPVFYQNGVGLFVCTSTNTWSPAVTAGTVGNNFFAVTGPTTSTKTFTFPNANATVLTNNAAVTVSQGGTGAAPGADDQVLVSSSTSAATWKTLSDCDGSNQAVTYDTTANAWGCVTITGGGGGGVGTVTNTGTLTSGRVVVGNGGVDVTVSQMGQGVLVKKSVNQTGANYTGSVAIAWDAEEYDDNTFHDNSTQNTRITIPSGVTRARFYCGVTLANVSNTTANDLTIMKNGASVLGGTGIELIPAGTATGRLISISTPPISVATNDYFECVLFQQTDTSIDVTAAASYFGAEVVQ